MLRTFQNGQKCDSAQMMVTMYITSKVDKINMCLSHSSKEWKAEDKGFFKSGSERKQGSLKE